MRDNNLVCKIPSIVSFLGIYRPQCEHETGKGSHRFLGQTQVPCFLQFGGPGCTECASACAYLMPLSPNASEKPWDSMEEVGISPVRKLEQGLEMLDFLRKGRELNLMGELRDFQE